MMKELSDAQIRIATESMIDEGKLRAVDVYNALRSVRAKAQRVLTLTVGTNGKPRQGAIAAAPAPVRRKPRTTPAQRASRRLQGIYIGLLRKLPEDEREEIRAIAAEGGRSRAVAAMRKRLKGRK